MGTSRRTEAKKTTKGNQRDIAGQDVPIGTLTSGHAVGYLWDTNGHHLHAISAVSCRSTRVHILRLGRDHAVRSRDKGRRWMRVRGERRGAIGTCEYLKFWRMRSFPCSAVSPESYNRTPRSEQPKWPSIRQEAMKKKAGISTWS